MQKPDPHIIISGGGTGGHVFPALAIARALSDRLPAAKILFIGASGKMEMEKVPAAGFPIEGLWISGLKRELSLSNLLFPVKVVVSLFRAMLIIRKFRADIAIGVGGFASGPALRAASLLGVPTMIQEQNSFPGITNKLLAKKAARICVAYPEMDRFFQADKIVLTGNPVRKEIIETAGKRDEAAELFGLNANAQTLFVVGGSQGAFSINTYIEQMLPVLKQHHIQLLWQTGRNYRSRAVEACQKARYELVKVTDFIQRMDLAYAMADLVVSRSGAIAIAELAAVGKPVIFIPFPHAAEDHQMKNAVKLAEKEAAIVIKDSEGREKLPQLVLELINDERKRKEMAENIEKFAIPDAAEKIANEVIFILER
jgi:UDP-N-acetylglucosamine--N-acetylmuramyl-(pentapeptide) pyrophosphoryl-undecaprenol N-acetylglucosamine transferase